MEQCGAACGLGPLPCMHAVTGKARFYQKAVTTHTHQHDWQCDSRVSYVSPLASGYRHASHLLREVAPCAQCQSMHAQCPGHCRNSRPSASFCRLLILLHPPCSFPHVPRICCVNKIPHPPPCHTALAPSQPPTHLPPPSLLPVVTAGAPHLLREQDGPPGRQLLQLREHGGVQPGRQPPVPAAAHR